MNKLHSNWKEYSFKDFCDITSSKRIFYREYVKSGIPFYRSKEIIAKSNGKELNDCLYISKDRFEEIKNKYGIPINGDILITAVGTYGIPYLINEDGDFYFKDGNLIWLKNIKDVADSNFLFYWFKSEEAKNKVEGIIIGSVQKALTIDAMKNIKINLPPLAEQKRIASILSALDDKIELNNKTNKILEEMAQTIFKEWFINFNFPNEDGKPYKKIGGEMIDSELGKIPKGWKVGTIGDYAKLKSGFAFKNSWWQNDGIPVIKIQNISSGNLNLEQCSFVSEDKYNIAENFRVNGGDLLITLTGSLGKFTIVPKLDKDALVNQRVGKFFLGEEPVKKLPFLYGILNELKDLIVSLANGSVQQNISPNDVENVKIIFPNDKILNKYNNLMQDIFYKIIFNQRENKKLSNIRDSLLPKLMPPNGRRADGKIRV